MRLAGRQPLELPMFGKRKGLLGEGPVRSCLVRAAVVSLINASPTPTNDSSAPSVDRLARRLGES